MVRWFKLFDHQYFGFWVLGLVLFAIQEIPYMVMPLFHLETNPIMNMVETSAALDVCEKVLGSLCIALMIFVVHEEAVCRGKGEAVLRGGGGRSSVEFLRLGIVFRRESERVRHDAVHCGDAAAVLCGDRAVEAECAAGGGWSCVPGGAFRACVWEFEGVEVAATAAGGGGLSPCHGCRGGKQWNSSSDGACLDHKEGGRALAGAAPEEEQG